MKGKTSPSLKVFLKPFLFVQKGESTKVLAFNLGLANSYSDTLDEWKLTVAGQQRIIREFNFR